MTTLIGNWNYPKHIRFGAGRIVELPDHCKLLGMKRPLLVTDAGLAALPMIAQAVKLCRDARLEFEVFADVQPNPVEVNVTAGVSAFRRGAHDGEVGEHVLPARPGGKASCHTNVPGHGQRAR